MTEGVHRRCSTRIRYCRGNILYAVVPVVPAVAATRPTLWAAKKATTFRHPAQERQLQRSVRLIASFHIEGHIG